MLIDWFTVGAQLVNFVVLVWLLKRFLYKPILDAINAREEKIAEQLDSAQAKQIQAQEERDKFEQKIADVDQQRASLLSQATEEANIERRRILDKARQDADALSARRLETLQKDAARLGDSITSKARGEVFSIARKVLTELAGASLEQLMCDVFIQKLQAVSGETREKFANALQENAKSTRLRSAFELSPSQRDAVRSSINKIFAANVPLSFEVVPDLVSGIEIFAEGQRLSWSIDEHLRSLEKGVQALLDAESGTGPILNTETVSRPA